MNSKRLQINAKWFKMQNCEEKDIVRFPIELHLEDEADMMTASSTSPTSSNYL